MHYLLLGSLAVVDEDTTLTITAPKIETLFATLLIRANQTVPTGDLIGEIWGEHPPRRVRAALQVYVSQLRKRFPETTLLTSGPGYRLEVAKTDVDATDLHRLHSRGLSLMDRDPETALATLRQAVGLFRGPVLGRIRNGLVVGAFARWADELRVDCLEAIGRVSLATGRHREVIGELAQWADEHPLHEPFRELLMVALCRTGRRAEALAVFQSARRVLRAELGLEPGQPMRRLQSAILSAERDLSLAS